MTKRKLSKLLGKDLQYTAILGEFSKQKGRILLTNVRHEGKLYADHVWILRTTGTKNIKEDSRIMFDAISYMYNDKFNIRKQGLNYCKNFQTLDEDYHNQLDQERNDANHKKKRKGY